MTYHNTTNLKGLELKNRKSKAGSQDKKILEFFLDNPSIHFAPFEVRNQAKLNCPLTSVRRSLNSLAGLDKITKTDKKKMGQYGMMVHTYKLNTLELF